MLAWPAVLIRWRIGGQSSSQQRPVASQERLPLSGGQVALALRAGLIGCRATWPQQVFELLGPALGIFLFDKGEFAQMVNVAERMATSAVLAVRLPAVVNADADIVGQDANGVGRLAPPLGVHGVVGEALRAGHMHPGQFACPPYPGPSICQNRPPRKAAPNLCSGRPRELSAFLNQV